MSYARKPSAISLERRGVPTSKGGVNTIRCSVHNKPREKRKIVVGTCSKYLCRITVKLQLTGKSGLILQFYFVIGQCG